MPRLVYMIERDVAPSWFMQAFGAHDAEIYDATRTYGSSTVFYHDLYSTCHDHIIAQLSQGHRIIFDIKNEHYLHENRQWIVDEFLRCPGQTMIIVSGQTAAPVYGIETLATPYWYWIIDQKSWLDFGLDSWQPAPDHRYSFFMQISLRRDDRDFLFDSLKDANLLNNALYSFRHRDIFLPDDVDPACYLGNWQRYVNKSWIDQTRFTLSVETYIRDYPRHGISFTLDDNLFLCEKSYKAMACQHPFLLASTYRNLAYLRSQGFETFPELFDETYDSICSWQDRVMAMIDNIARFDPSALGQSQVRDKIRHNHARFFDRALTKKFLHDTIVAPVMEWINA